MRQKSGDYQSSLKVIHCPQYIRGFFTIFGRLNLQLLSLWTYITAYGKSVKDGYRSNAFSPLVWYVFFPLIPLFGVILTTKNNIVMIICTSLGAILILFPLVMYVVLLIKDPKLLQSEWYRLEDKKLTMIAEKGGEVRIEDADLSAKGKITGGIDE